MSKRRVGAHVSMSGGLDKAVERAARIGANCAQIFSGSPRMWRRKSLDKVDPKKLFSKQEELDVKPIFIHALYLINLASDKPELIDKSIRSLIYDLKLNDLIKGSGVVVHLGSHQGRGFGAVKNQLVNKIEHVLSEAPAGSKLLIEDSAGQNGKLASNLEEIRWLIDQVSDDRLGWCVDTCHAFAAGYALSPDSNLSSKSDKPDLFSAISDLDLWSNLSCIHVNDSKAEFDSGNDRHENINQGLIPQSDLKDFLNYEKVKSIPLITEVPGIDNNGPDEENVTRLKNLLIDFK